MMNISVEINDHRVMAHFEQLPEQIRQALRTKITELTHQLLVQVQAREPVRTGRLRQLTRRYVDEKQDFIRGRVRILGRRGINQPARAFGALEYGAHRRFAVKGYRRGSSRVRPYERRANIRARRFLRGPASVMLPRAKAEIEAIILAAVRGVP